MTYGWSTRKQPDGRYFWAVYRVEYQKPLFYIASGFEPTRARAMRRAKTCILPLRRAARA